MKLLFIAIAMLLGVSSCARDAVRTLPRNPAAGATGSIKIVLSSPSRGVAVTVDAVLVASGLHTQHILVNNVPAGEHEVAVVVGGQVGSPGESKQRVHVAADRTSSVLVPGEDTSFRSSVAAAVGSINLTALGIAFLALL